MLISAKLKGCVTWFIYFLDLVWVRYNCAKFVGYVWQILGRGGLFAPPILEQPRKSPSWIGLSCAKISLLMFLRRIFSNALWGSGRAPLLRFDGISFGSLKIWSPRTDLWPELRKESDLDYDYAQVLSYVLLKQSNSFRFLRQYYHYYQRYINPAAIKIRKHF